MTIFNTTFCTNPIEQFLVFPLVLINIFGFNFSLTNSTVFLFLVFIFFIIITITKKCIHSNISTAFFKKYYFLISFIIFLFFCDSVYCLENTIFTIEDLENISNIKTSEDLLNLKEIARKKESFTDIAELEKINTLYSELMIQYFFAFIAFYLLWAGCIFWSIISGQHFLDRLLGHIDMYPKFIGIIFFAQTAGCKDKILQINYSDCWYLHYKYITKHKNFDVYDLHSYFVTYGIKFQGSVGYPFFGTLVVCTFLVLIWQFLYIIFYKISKLYPIEEIKKVKRLTIAYYIFMTFYVIMSMLVLFYSFFNTSIYAPVCMIFAYIFDNIMILLNLNLTFAGCIHIITLVYSFIFFIYCLFFTSFYSVNLINKIDSVPAYYDYTGNKYSLYYHTCWMQIAKDSDNIDMKQYFITILMNDEYVKKYLSQFKNKIVILVMYKAVNDFRQELYYQIKEYEKVNGPLTFPNQEEKNIPNLLIKLQPEINTNSKQDFEANPTKK